MTSRDGDGAPDGSTLVAFLERGGEMGVRMRAFDREASHPGKPLRGHDGFCLRLLKAGTQPIRPASNGHFTDDAPGPV